PVGDLFVRQANAKKPENFLLARGKVGRRPALPHFVTLSCHARTSDALVSSCVKLTGVRLPAPSRYDAAPNPPGGFAAITAITKLPGPSASAASADRSDIAWAAPVPFTSLPADIFDAKWHRHRPYSTVNPQPVPSRASHRRKIPCRRLHWTGGYPSRSPLHRRLRMGTRQWQAIPHSNLQTECHRIPTGSACQVPVGVSAASRVHWVRREAASGPRRRKSYRGRCLAGN